VRFLVQIAERHCVGKQLVELGGDFQPNQLFEFKGQQMVDRSVCLNFSRVDETGVALWLRLMSGFHVRWSRRILSSVSSYSLLQKIFDFSVQVASYPQRIAIFIRG
jgi:hypothetical protein